MPEDVQRAEESVAAHGREAHAPLRQSASALNLAPDCDIGPLRSNHVISANSIQNQADASAPAHTTPTPANVPADAPVPRAAPALARPPAPAAAAAPVPLAVPVAVLSDADAPRRLGSGGAPSNSQWLAQVASQAQTGVRQRMSQASGQLGHSLRQLYASASSIAGPVAAAAVAAAGTASAAAGQDGPPSYHNIPGIVPFYHGRSVGPPPSYEDVVDPYAPPPTYQSLFGQMREARKSSRGLLDLLRRLLIIIVSTLGCTLLIAFMILIPFTMIIIGAVYIHDCNIDHIPAFLLTGGLVWAAKNLLHCYAQCRKAERQERNDAALAAELYLAQMSDGYSLASSGSSSSSSASSDAASINDDSATNSSSAGAVATVAPPPSELNVANGHLAPPGADSTSLADSDGSLRSFRPAYQRDHPLHCPPPPPPRRSRRSTAPAGRSGARRHHQHQQQHQHQQRQPHAQPLAARRRLKSSICESLLNCVLFGWFVAGCVIVFRNYEPDYENPVSARYCHRTVYMYAFWLITSALLSFGLFIGCICCLMVSSALASRHDELELA